MSEIKIGDYVEVIESIKERLIGARGFVVRRDAGGNPGVSFDDQSLYVFNVGSHDCRYFSPRQIKVVEPAILNDKFISELMSIIGGEGIEKS